MTTLLEESVSKPTLSLKGNRWRVKIITPGVGSSGIWSQEVLKEYVPAAIPVGSHSYINHPDDPKRVKRNPKDMIGTMATDPEWDEAEGAMVAEIDVFPHWKEFVEAVAPHTGLSIFAAGDKDADGNVTMLEYNVQNSVDLVSYAGRGGGMIEKLYESAISYSPEIPAEASAGDNKEKQMDNEALAKVFESMTTAFGAVVTRLDTLAEVLTPDVVDGEVDFAAVAEAVVAEEKLTPKARARVFESVKNGKDVQEAIAEWVEILEEAATASQERHVFEESADALGKNEKATLGMIGAWS